jgi:hypothetical protein
MAINPLNPVVARALQSILTLTGKRENLPSRDIATVVEAFDLLRVAGEHIDPSEIYIWVSRHEHGSDGLANALSGIAADVIEGKRTPSKPRHWNPNVVDLWRATSH